MKTLTKVTMRETDDERGELVTINFTFGNTGFLGALEKSLTPSELVAYRDGAEHGINFEKGMTPGEFVRVLRWFIRNIEECNA